jgi:hypothetical protein
MQGHHLVQLEKMVVMVELVLEVEEEVPLIMVPNQVCLQGQVVPVSL